MITKFVEATNGLNWGKFAVGRWTPEEWARRSAIDTEDRRPLLWSRGWSIRHLLVLDLQTGQGAIFSVHKDGQAAADLHKAQIWVCPLFRPFLEWLYQQDLTTLAGLPDVVEVTDANVPLCFGLRRPEP